LSKRKRYEWENRNKWAKDGDIWCIFRKPVRIENERAVSVGKKLRQL
jgi:hypothetical protein